jgi:hypothetical protein
MTLVAREAGLACPCSCGIRVGISCFTLACPICWLMQLWSYSWAGTLSGRHTRPALARLPDTDIYTMPFSFRLWERPSTEVSPITHSSIIPTSLMTLTPGCRSRRVHHSLRMQLANLGRTHRKLVQCLRRALSTKRRTRTRLSFYMCREQARPDTVHTR